MNHRKSAQWVLYLLAIVLTLALILPSLTTAQDLGGSRDVKPEATAGVDGWTRDAQGNLYFGSGKVGVGSQAHNVRFYDQQLQVLNYGSRDGRITGGNAEIMMMAANNYDSILHLREANKNWGFSFIYDGDHPDPFARPGFADSGMFGLWRYNDGIQQEPPALTVYRQASNVGIGALPSDRGEVRLVVGGHQLIQAPDRGWESGDVARLNLGDYAHYLQAKYGEGIQFSTFQVPYAMTIQDATGYVGIGTGYKSPRAKLEISGQSGVEGLHLSLEQVSNPQPGHKNSPMIKWDSTAYSAEVNRIWYARAQGNDWVLVSSESNYNNANTIIKASPDGEICIGSGCG